MIQLRSTPKGAGLEMAGTSDDFTGLYNAIHTMINKTDQKKGDPVETHEGTHLLSLAYDLRKAMPISFPREKIYKPEIDTIPSQDPRSFMHVEDQWFDLDIGDRLHFFRLWPHVIADLVVLRRYIGSWMDRYQGARKGMDFSLPWTLLVLYRNLVQQSILETLPETRRTAVRNLMQENEYSLSFSHHWVEYLTMKFLSQEPEDRLNNLSKLVKNIHQPGGEYDKLRASLNRDALNLGCHVDELGFNYSVPEWGEW